MTWHFGITYEVRNYQMFLPMKYGIRSFCCRNSNNSITSVFHIMNAFFKFNCNNTV